LKRMRFIHRIDPNIDLEREKIINDLFAAGCLARWTYAGRPGVPKYSINATDDLMQTDRTLAVLRLRDCRDPELPAAGGRAKVKHGSTFRRWARKQILTLRYDLVHANIFGGAYQAIRAVHHTLSSGPPQASASRAVDGYSEAAGED
jgi:hypothetical protein